MGNDNKIFSFNSPMSPTLWLRADKGINLNGSTVYQWDDQSGNGYNATQSIVASQPTYVENFSNGRPALLFNSDYLNLNFGLTGRHIFIVSNYINESFTGNPGLIGVPDDIGLYYLIGGDNNYSHFVTSFYGTVYINGIQTSDYSPNATVKIVRVDASTFWTLDLTIAACIYGYWIGHIAEILMYEDSLSPSDISSIENYLRIKYGI